MTQPQNVSMLVCNDCGSVRVPVPAITSKVVVLNVPPSVVPCPVCLVTKTLKDAMSKKHTCQHGLTLDRPFTDCGYAGSSHVFVLFEEDAQPEQEAAP